MPVEVITAEDEVVTILTLEQGPPGPAGPAGPASTVPGPVGPQGPRGNAMLYGDTDPFPSTGINGDFYINTVTDFLFGPKTSGAWPAGESLIGPQGVQGLPGTSFVLVSDTPPVGALDNTFWWQSTTCILWLRYNDGNSSQWVQAVVPPALDQSGGGGGGGEGGVSQGYVDGQDALRVLKSGDTMTGSLTLTSANLAFNAPVAVPNQILAYKDGALRWNVQLGTGGGEAAGDGGSSFAIMRYSNAGALLDTPFAINRSNGKVVVTGNPTAALEVVPMQYADLKVAKTGGTMTGNLVMASTAIVQDCPPTGANQIIAMKGGKYRWNIQMGQGGSSEPGGNVGSNLAIYRYDDAGNYIDSCFAIDRKSGKCSVNGSPIGAWDIVTKQYADDQSNTKVSKSGDTMSGDLKISKAAASIIFDKSGNGQNCGISGLTNGVQRWLVAAGDGNSESGGNNGSGFSLYSYADNGAYLGNPLNITRAGAVSFNGTSAGFGGAVSMRGLLYNYGGQITLDHYLGVYVTRAYNNGPVEITDGLVLNGNQTVISNYHTPGVSVVNRFTINGTGQFDFESSGYAYKAGGGTWAAWSDARIKTIVGEYKRGLADIIKLPDPVIYTYKGNDKAPLAPQSPVPTNLDFAVAAQPLTKHVGFIAQQVEPVWPEMVRQITGFIDGKALDDLRTMDTTPMLYALVNAVKELAAHVEALEAKV